jgi:hypothetical protein
MINNRPAMKSSVVTIFVSFLIAITLGCGGNTSNKKSNVDAVTTDTSKNMLTVKGMHDDLSVLWSVVKELHPGYGIYTSPTDLQKAYDKTYSSIKSPLSEGQFIDLIYPFVCELRCGHTQLKHSVLFKPSASEKVPHLPFKVLVRNHHVWVTMHQTADVNTGDEIIDINGVPVSEIVDRGYGLYCGDGYAETFKELFLSEYDGFEDACNKCYHWPGPYQIKVQTAKGVLKTINVKPAEAGAVAEDPKLKPADNFANWTVVKDIPDSRLRFFKKSSTAWFSAPPFAYADTIVYKNAFASIKEKGIKNLVLDLRHNTGGDIRVATQLLSYLADAPFNVVKEIKSRIPDLAHNRFAKYFDTTVTQGFVLGFKTGGKVGDWYHVDATTIFGQMYGPFQLAEKDHFNGNLIVLIDGATFSSGALLTAALKAQRKNIKFIGRETAGAEEGCNGVTLQKLTLPNTKIIVDFPWMRVVSVAKNPVKGRGIMPDYDVNYKPEDVVRNNDLDLKKAMSLIR